jgi:GNAT superfamily N-acetyltransferase
MTLLVRDFRTEDAATVAALRRVCVPHQVVTEQSVLFGVATANPAKKYRLLIAEEDGVIIGTAHVGIAYDSSDPGQSSVTPQVHPERLGRGAGSLLLRTAEEHLAVEGATSVYAWAVDEPSCRAFAEHRGYRPTRAAHFQRLGLAEAVLPEPPALPPGFALRTAADFTHNPRPLFDADAETTSDEPGDISTDFDDYEDWLHHTWNDPCLDRGLSTVVVAPDGRVAAFTSALTDGRTTYASGMTGTLRAYRGRGLAKLAKSDSLRRARAAGYTDAFTHNDGENGPMLAVNKWFGYEFCASEVRHVRTFG